MGRKKKMALSQRQCSKLKTAIKNLLERIAERHGKTHGDIVVAEACPGPNYRGHVSVYAVRQWLTRGIPEKHWPTVADLAGVTVDELRRLHGT